ncbi:MAG: hypothetical protein PHU71_00165 [Candidatus Gracilibacteria bacterium]|nr:hypothetical protein [Candidatus Gracilibacteria bacterium]
MGPRPYRTVRSGGHNAMPTPKAPAGKNKNDANGYGTTTNSGNG